MPEGHAPGPPDEQRDDVRGQPGRRGVQPEEHPDPEDCGLAEEEHPRDDVRERALEALHPVPSPDPRRHEGEDGDRTQREQRARDHRRPRIQREPGHEDPDPTGQDELLEGKPSPRRGRG